MNYKHETLWPFIKRKLYTMCTLILSNPLNLTIELKLNLTQSEL
jgi:hypothetical protein